MDNLQKRFNELANIVGIQSSDPASRSDPYMHGMANGLILAQATMLGINPEYIEKVEGEEAERNFEGELASLLNRYSYEGKSNTPDFILAKYLAVTLEAYNVAVTGRDRWNGTLRTSLVSGDQVATDRGGMFTVPIDHYTGADPGNPPPQPMSQDEAYAASVFSGVEGENETRIRNLHPAFNPVEHEQTK